MQRILIFGLITLGAATILLVGCQTTRSGYETAPYTTVHTEGAFSLRDYPTITVVQTEMYKHGQEDNGSFSRLFRFITGRNDTGQKIPMTTPVFMSGENQERTMAFVLPAQLKANVAPRPTDETVKLHELPAGRFAVLRFSGGRNPKAESAALARLQDWLEPQNLRPLLPPVYAYFDPPWTPAFLRRNEVMIRLSP